MVNTHYLASPPFYPQSRPIMPDLPSSLKATLLFLPRPLESVQVDKLTVKLYPVVNLSMQASMHAHAFQTNKTALSIPGIDRRAMLDTLGTQLNLSTIVDGVLGDWNCHFRCNWCNFAHLTILSFHSNAGTQVNNTTDPNDSAVLLPVVNGPYADCCKQVQFVRVQLNLDFASLVPPSVQGLTILRVEYYIELPQSSQDMLNGNAQNYRLMSWLGTSNLRTIPAVEFAQNVLAHTLQDGPIDLLHPDFNLTSAKMDSTNIEAEISSKIIHIATPLVLESLFDQLCPGYLKEPHAALDHVRQTYNDANGNKVFLSVYNYYTQILAASRPFIDMETLPVSVCQAFIDGFDQISLSGISYTLPQLQYPSRSLGNPSTYGPPGNAAGSSMRQIGVQQHQSHCVGSQWFWQRPNLLCPGQRKSGQEDNLQVQQRHIQQVRQFVKRPTLLLRLWRPTPIVTP
jgi:hypothetical protein